MLKFNYEDRHRYDDIIDLTHHVSKTHPHMPAADRAAQFAPFAALTGHGAAVKETARLTKERMELDESCKALINRQLTVLKEQADKEPSVSITYFVEDQKKSGGAYVSASGCVKKIDEYKKLLILADGTRIPIADIIEIESQDIGIFA